MPILSTQCTKQFLDLLLIKTLVMTLISRRQPGLGRPFISVKTREICQSLAKYFNALVVMLNGTRA